MKALILNSGLGSRMGLYTSEHPKCMTDISNTESILSNQLRLLKKAGVTDVVMTTGYYDKVLVEYCNSLGLSMNYEFVFNPLYSQTNYIYSIYCARKQLRGQDVVMMHGDLVFTLGVLEKTLNSQRSCMVISTTLPLPEKDFKAVVNGDKIERIGIDFFDSAVAAQPLYKIFAKDWNVWLDKIVEFCENEQRKCYAENAFNQVSDNCKIYALDIKDELCGEIDTPQDLEIIKKKFEGV